jgi:hypothetical protein
LIQPKRIPAVAALVTLALHLAGNPHYGFFRDELYFIICGFHPAFGYVDQPPVAPLLAAGSQLFGHSLFLLRAIPAIFAAAGAYVTCLLAIELGGGAFAQVLAAIAFFFANVLMSFGMKVGPDMTGLWLWPLAALYVLRIAKGRDPRLWLGAGAAIGVSLESKYSVAFYAFALVAAVALTPHRRLLSSRWFLGRGACRGDCAPQFPVASRSRLSDVGAAAQRPKREEPGRRAGALSLPAAAANESFPVTDLDRRTDLALVEPHGALSGIHVRDLDDLDDRLARQALLCGKRLSDPHRRRRRGNRWMDETLDLVAGNARRGSGGRGLLLSAVFAAGAF